MQSADIFRLGMMRHLASVSSFSDSWSDWLPTINRELTATPTPQHIFDLGEKLHDIFRSRSVIGRDNSAVSTGGTAWEALVCWYLNLVLYGSDVVAIRPHANFTPQVFKDALSVNISNNSTNTESDLIVFSIPNASTTTPLNLGVIDNLIRAHTASTDVAVVQCKTNWNDNSQIPMLWDLIYNSQTFRVPNVSVGRGGVSPASFRKFVYSFMTVPTSRGPYTPTNLAVLRVRGLTGGNYWGKPTVSGVARSVSEFFTTNFATHLSGTVQQHIKNNLMSDPAILRRFLDLDF